MLWVSWILSVPTHSLISPQPQPARGINELSIIVESARSAHFQHRIKIDSICKEEIKKSTQNEIEMQDKCKFSQRGRELGTRIASVETAACVRLVANQHQAPGTKHRATSRERRTSSQSDRRRARENRLQLCTGLVCIGLQRTADRSCFIPSPLVRLCVWRASLPGWLAWLGSASASAWQINSHSAIRHKLARTQGTERRAHRGIGTSGDRGPCPVSWISLDPGLCVHPAWIRLWMGFTTSLKGTCRPRHDSGSEGWWVGSGRKGTRGQRLLADGCSGSWRNEVSAYAGGVGAGATEGVWEVKKQRERNKQKSIIVLRVFPLLLRIFYLDFERFFFNSFNL